MISFRALWREIRPALALHESPCVPEVSTDEPHWQMCAAHIEVPKRGDAATLMTASSMRNPAAVIGAACSQSPEWVDITASKRALFRELAAELIRKSLSYSTRGISHLLCCLESSPTDALKPPIFFQLIKEKPRP